MDISSNTPKVLDRCLQLFDQPSVARESQSKPSTPARYASHPDIQFFSSVKSKHHFAYHHSKITKAQSGTKPKRNSSLFHPYSRAQLLQRLDTYTSLHWAIPYTKSDILTELECARSGWVAVKKGTNHLQCVSCESHTILRFNDLDSQPTYSVVPLSLADIAALNHQLKIAYLDKLRSSAHSRNCPWRNFQCPYKVYYLPPHLASTDEVLIEGYVKALKKVVDQDIGLFASALSKMTETFSFPDIVPVSKQWLVATYYNEVKENFELTLDKKLSRSAYLISALGWTLKKETFQEKIILILKCRSCTSKHFLEMDSTSYDLSHKSWCLYSNDMAGIPGSDYFINMLVASERNIGPAGKYQSNLGVDENPPEVKYDGNVDVKDTLNKMSELSKLYFADPAMKPRSKEC